MTSADRLDAFLARHRVLAIDTSPFIYHLQQDHRYAPLTAVLFAAIEGRRRTAVTSTLTMTELLVRPYRENAHAVVNRIFALASRFPNLMWIPPSLEIADRAAELRARHNLRTPDAIQAATALDARATGFVANDQAFRRVDGLEVFLFDD